MGSGIFEPIENGMPGWPITTHSASLLQVLEDQQLMTTERTRRLMLKIIIEGFLSDTESEDAWEKKLIKAMHDHEGGKLNCALWSLLTLQVQPVLPYQAGACSCQ